MLETVILEKVSFISCEAAHSASQVAEYTVIGIPFRSDPQNASDSFRQRAEPGGTGLVHIYRYIVAGRILFEGGSAAVEIAADNRYVSVLVAFRQNEAFDLNADLPYFLFRRVCLKDPDHSAGILIKWKCGISEDIVFEVAQHRII